MMINVIENLSHICLIEIGGEFYVVYRDNYTKRVWSVVPGDKREGWWVGAPFTRKGIKSVAKGRTRENARRWFNRMVKEERR